MTWKYVMFGAIVPMPNGIGKTIVELPVLFAPEISHKQIADGVRRGTGRARDSRIEIKPISAGFVDDLHDSQVRCYGRSESLGIASHPGDTDILRDVARRDPFFY